MFLKKYSCNLSLHLIEINLRTLLSKWEEEEYGKLRFLRNKANNSATYRYLCSSRSGVIHIHFRKKKNTLNVTIIEYVSGYYLPLTLFLFGLLLIYLENFYSSLIIIAIAVFFLVYIYINFVVISERIKNEILIPLSKR